MSVSNAGNTIFAAVTSWQGVHALPHRFGGTEFRLGEKREIGHVHGDSLVDIPFPTQVREQLVAEGRAERHHILPDSGWVSFYLRRPEHVAQVIELLRLSYKLAQKQVVAQTTPPQSR